jgi:hypothetical protein
MWLDTGAVANWATTTRNWTPMASGSLSRRASPMTSSSSPDPHQGLLRLRVDDGGY